MNEKNKHMRQKNEKQRELTELLNLLNAVDQQLTPEHVAMRFRELLEATGDGSAPPADSDPALPEPSAGSEKKTEQGPAPCHAYPFQDETSPHTPNFDLVDIVGPSDRWNLSADIVNAARAQADAIIAIAQLRAERINTEARHAKTRAAEEYEKARQVLAEAQQNDDAALNRAATMIADARRQAEEILAAAHGDADQVLADARRQAEEILAAAREREYTRREREYTRFEARDALTILFVGPPGSGKSALIARLVAQTGRWPQELSLPDELAAASEARSLTTTRLVQHEALRDHLDTPLTQSQEEIFTAKLTDTCFALPDFIASCAQHSPPGISRPDSMDVRRPADGADETKEAQLRDFSQHLLVNFSRCELKARAVTTPFSRDYFAEAYARILDATVTATDAGHVNGPLPAGHGHTGEHQSGVVARRDVNIGGAAAREMAARTAGLPLKRPSPEETSRGAPAAQRTPPRRERELGELESAIMDVLWAADRAYLVREVRARLTYSRPVAYTTVMTVMNILYGKGVLCREKRGRAWRYWPAESREEHDARLMAEVPRSGGDEHITRIRFEERVSDETPTPQPELSGTNTLPVSCPEPSGQCPR